MMLLLLHLRLSVVGVLEVIVAPLLHSVVGPECLLLVVHQVLVARVKVRAAVYIYVHVVWCIHKVLIHLWWLLFHLVQVLVRILGEALHLVGALQYHRDLVERFVESFAILF